METVTIPEIAMTAFWLVLGLIGSLLALLYGIWSRTVTEHAKMLREIPERYATKNDLRELGDRIDENLRDIKAELAAGNKTNQLLLTALLTEERKMAAGIHTPVMSP